MLIIAISLGKVPDGTLRLVVVPPPQNAAPRMVIDIFIRPLPHVADHIHCTKWARARGMSIHMIGLGEREWLGTINALPPNLIYKSASETAKELVPEVAFTALLMKSTGAVSPFSIGDRVFHQKFGNGDVVGVEGNKLTIAFDKAGEKRVVDSFIERV